MTSPIGVAPSPDQLPALLEPWIADQRWYPATGSPPRLRELGRFALPASAIDGPEDPARAIVTHLMLDESASPAALYQIPIVYRASTDAPDPASLIGEFDGTAGRTVLLVDGPRDTAYATSLLRLVLDGSRAGEPGAAGAQAWGERSGPPRDLRIASSRVLSGEQSNTSIIYELRQGASAATPVICKVFRAMHEGVNPDVELQTALSEDGSPWVPAVVGHVEGRWTDADGGTAAGQLAFAQQFVEGVQDAWRVALSLAEAGAPFGERARSLGSATAEVHEELARRFPTLSPSVREVESVLDGMRGRFAAAVDAVPTLAERRDAAHAVFERAALAPWPALQRIHGDYHLGQVLWSEGRGWILLDFEGEPLRPMAERARPDMALRDVAGMLRSFDYVAGTHAAGPAADAARNWAEAARVAFLEGYVQRSGIDLTAQQPLLDAFELDKAVYEAVYEARNRPGWLPIPVAAIARLTAR